MSWTGFARTKIFNNYIRAGLVSSITLSTMAKSARKTKTGTAVKKRLKESRKKPTGALDGFVTHAPIVIDQDSETDSVFGDNVDQMQLIQNTTHIPPGKRPYVIGIDIGIKNIGMCVFSRDPAVNNVVHWEASTLLETADGRVYKDYEEKYNHELVYNWVKDRWPKWFGQASLVVLEKQMIGAHAQWHNGERRAAVGKPITQKERACITIETALKCYLWRERENGGPRFHVVRAQDWKKKAGIELGNHGLVEKNLQKQRVINKARAAATFDRWLKTGNKYALEAASFGKACTPDMCDAFFAAYLAFVNHDKIYAAANKTSHHHSKLTKMLFMKPIESI